MKKRLDILIGRFYNPPSKSTRQVFTFSREEAERLPVIEGLAMISITAPERPLAKVNGHQHLLRLAFADVDFLNAKLSARAKQKLPDAMTRQQAWKIIEFIESLPETVHSIAIHCEGGFSRSCAIALVLHQCYGYQVEKERLSHANPSVVTLLSKEIKKD